MKGNNVRYQGTQKETKMKHRIIGRLPRAINSVNPKASM